MTVMVAPILGPTLGGWITETYSWRWIFYINVPIGMIALFLVAWLMHDPPYLKELRDKSKRRGLRMDYVSVAVRMFTTFAAT